MASFSRCFPSFLTNDDKENTPAAMALPAAENAAVPGSNEQTVAHATDKIDEKDDNSESATDALMAHKFSSVNAQRPPGWCDGFSSDDSDSVLDESINLYDLGAVTTTPTNAAPIGIAAAPRKDFVNEKRKTQMELPTNLSRNTSTPMAKHSRAGKKKAPPASSPTPAARATTTTTTPPPKTPAASHATPATNNVNDPKRSAMVKAASTKKKQKKSRQPPVKKGSRIKVRRSQMFHLLEPHLQQFLPREHPNCQNCCGEVIGKAVGPTASHDMRLDVFRGDDTIAKGVRRTVFTTTTRGQDEPEKDLKHANKEMEAEANDLQEKNDKGEINSEKQFVKLSKKELLEATTFAHEFANKKKVPVQRTVLADDKDVTGCDKTNVLREAIDKGPMLQPEIEEALQTLPVDEFFLQHLWPSMDGFAARMDLHCEDTRAKHFRTVKGRNIKFHDETNVDPDWKLKQFVLLAAKGAAVHGRGTSEFWIAGKLCEGSSLDGADFGKHMDVNMCHAVAEALPFVWGDQSLWCKDRRDVPWQTFAPFIDAWNAKPKSLLIEFAILIMDETFIAWCPKTTKLGGLPNCSCEPRKPKGTRNDAQRHG